MIETALRDALLADATVGALVGGKRVYPVVLPQAPVYPAISYQMISGQSHYGLSGPSRLASPRVQVDCYAESFDAVMDLRSAVIACLGGYRAVISGVTVHGAFKISEADFFEGELTATGGRIWRKSLDFNIWFKE